MGEPSIIKKVFLTTMGANIVATFAYAVGPVVDGIMIGSFLGVDAVAALGLFSPAIMVYSLVAGIISGGARSLCATVLGEGDNKKANGIFTLSFVSTILLSTLLAVLTIAFVTPFSQLLGATGKMANLLQPTVDYIIGFCVGVPFMNGARVLAAYLQMDGDKEREVYSTVAMTVFDIVGDLVVVFLLQGRLGGLLGMGLATSFGYVVNFLLILPHYFMKRANLRFSLKDMSLKPLVEIVQRGAGAGVSRICAMISRFAINRVLAAVTSSVVVAAYALQGSMNTLFSAVYIGVADAVWVLSSIYYGEEDKKALEELQKTALRVGLLLNVVLAVFVFLFAGGLAGLYIDRTNPEAVRLGAESVRFFALAMPLGFLYYLFDDYLMGIRKLREANVLMFVQAVAVTVPVTVIAIVLMGGRGAWVAFPFTMLVTLLALVPFIRRQNGATFSEKCLCLPKDFGVGVEQEMDLALDSTEEVMMLSRIATLFCMENGVDKNRGKMLALAIEEMAGNIVEYGFNDGKEHSINIRMFLREDDLILRVRDDCKPFNPKQQYELMREEKDDFSGIGIRLIVGLAKDFQYVSTFNTNNLIVRL